MTDKQRELARHALGFPNKKNTSYRNHFCTGPGDDNFPEWEAMVAQGEAIKQTGPHWGAVTGRTLCIPVPYSQDDLQGGGCALGMAARARGDKYYGDKFRCNADEIMSSVSYPCECNPDSFSFFNMGWVIAHLFNEHVFGKKDWTLDQLIDWVRSVEPEETPSLSDAVATQEARAEVGEKNLIESL